MEVLQDVINSPEELEIEGLSSPIASQILDFCDEDGDLFAETLRNSDVSSSSINGGGSCGSGGDGRAGSSGLRCYDDNCLTASLSPFPSMDLAVLSTLVDPQTSPKLEPDIASSFACPSEDYPPTMLPVHPYLSDQQGHFDQVVLADGIANECSAYSADAMVPLPMAPSQPQLQTVYEGDCLPAYGGLDAPTPPSCSFVDPGISAFYPSHGISLLACGDGQGFFPASMMMNVQLGLGEYDKVDARGGAVYMPELMQQVYSSGDVQVAGDSQQMVGGCSSPTTLVSDIPPLDDSGINKVGRLSAEERKEKIQRYKKKRNQRNFSKKIKYACRKTLADSRPRVRGRFAKNDELGEVTRPSSNCHEFDDDEEVSSLLNTPTTADTWWQDSEVVVKEVDDILDSSDILAHISGLNSFKYNYSLESWT